MTSRHVSPHLWPSACPCCASRRIAVWQHDGTWSCWACGADSNDTTEERTTWADPIAT